MSRFTQLIHYAAESGRTYLVASNDLAPRLVEMCAPTISQGEHPLPMRGYRLKVVAFRDAHGRLEGTHAFLLYESRLVTVFTVALRQKAAEPLWRQFESYYLGTTDRGLLARADWPAPKMPDLAPWVASFPIECTELETRFSPDFIRAWAATFSHVAIDETNRCT